MIFRLPKAVRGVAVESDASLLRLAPNIQNYVVL